MLVVSAALLLQFLSGGCVLYILWTFSENQHLLRLNDKYKGYLLLIYKAPAVLLYLGVDHYGLQLSCVCTLGHRKCGFIPSSVCCVDVSEPFVHPFSFGGGGVLFVCFGNARNAFITAHVENGLYSLSCLCSIQASVAGF